MRAYWDWDRRCEGLLGFVTATESERGYWEWHVTDGVWDYWGVACNTRFEGLMGLACNRCCEGLLGVACN